MLPLSKTFRTLSRRDIVRFQDGSLSDFLYATDMDCLTGSPFDNPARTIAPKWTPNESPSPADIDLLRAAYFATVPVAD